MTAPQTSCDTIRTADHARLVSESTELGYVRYARATSDGIPPSVPTNELWLWRNQRELRKTLRAREQLTQGPRVYKGDFAQYAENDTGG